MPHKLNNDRKFPGCKNPRPDHFKLRQTEAAERQAAYDKLSIAEKLEKLDNTYGKDLGAAKQRAKLASLLAVPASHVAIVTERLSAFDAGDVPMQSGEEVVKRLRAKDRRRNEKNNAE